MTPGSDHHEDAPGIGRLIGISIDCSEPTTLAEFYRSLTGWAFARRPATVWTVPVTKPVAIKYRISKDDEGRYRRCAAVRRALARRRSRRG